MRAVRSVWLLPVLVLFSSIGCAQLPTILLKYDNAPPAEEIVTVETARTTPDNHALVCSADALSGRSTPVEATSQGVGPSPYLLTSGPALAPLIWGVAGFRGFVTGAQVAPNGIEFNPLFSADLNLNLWLCKEERVYAFTDMRFWGQKAAPGITNGSQGAFDFSKREFDLDIGAAWNYAGPFEARFFAYSFNNLNRGTSLARPNGFKDGVGLENRWYVGGSYADLGQTGFDVARATFLSLGFYPTKDMVDAFGNSFKPGPFAHAYLTLDVIDTWCYLFADVQAIATKSFTPKLIDYDTGIAFRPFARYSHVEFRLGSAGKVDFQLHEFELDFYGAVRVIF